MTQEKKTYLKYILWLNLVLGFQNLYFYVNNESLFNLLVGSLNIGVWVFYRKKAGSREWILGITETIIVITIAFTIGFVNDKIKPKEYYYGNRIVKIYKKYQCPKWCDVNHHHYVHYDSTIVHNGGMVINKNKIGKEYKPPTDYKTK